MKTIEEFLDEKIGDDWADISIGGCADLIRQYSLLLGEELKIECSKIAYERREASLEILKIDLNDFIK